MWDLCDFSGFSPCFHQGSVGYVGFSGFLALSGLDLGMGGEKSVGYVGFV